MSSKLFATALALSLMESACESLMVPVATPTDVPMPVSVYETSDGQVYIGALNLESMSMMFGGTVHDVLKEGAENYAKTLKDIAEESHVSLDLSRIPAFMMRRMMEHMPDE